MIDHHSHNHRELVKGKTIHVYINGDLFFEAKPVVVSKKTDRTFESFLNRLTDYLNPRFGVIRNLKSVDGTTEIKSLDQLETGASYVAYGNKFQNLQYTDISARLRALAHPPPLTSPREGTIIGSEARKLVVSGRARKIVRHPVVINVYANGQPLKPAKRVLLQPWVHKTWDNVLEQIAIKLIHMNGAIRKLYDLDTKTQVKSGADLQDQHFYVAVGHEKFKDFEYGLSQTMFTPKQQMAKRYPTLPPIEPKERAAAKDKPNQSAPSESKRDYQPKPPPRKSEPQSPVERENEKTAHPISFQETHRVSPIEEQKTPSSTTAGTKEPTKATQPKEDEKSPANSPRPTDLADGEERAGDKIDSPNHLSPEPVADYKTLRADTPKAEETPRADSRKAEETPRADSPKAEETPRADSLKAEETPRTDTPKAEETPRTDTPKAEETPRADTPKAEETPRADTPKAEETPRADTPKAEETPRADSPKAEETPRTDTLKAEETPRTDTPKAEETSRADTPKAEETPRADTPKAEETPRADTPKAEETLRADTPKAEETPRADTPKAEEIPRADSPKAEETPRADTPKTEETPRADTPKAEETPRADSPKADDTAKPDGSPRSESAKPTADDEKNIASDNKEDNNNNLNDTNPQAAPVTSQG